jgi:hypothetical protein
MNLKRNIYTNIDWECQTIAVLLSDCIPKHLYGFVLLFNDYNNLKILVHKIIQYILISLLQFIPYPLVVKHLEVSQTCFSSKISTSKQQ